MQEQAVWKSYSDQRVAIKLGSSSDFVSLPHGLGSQLLAQFNCVQFQLLFTPYFFHRQLVEVACDEERGRGRRGREEGEEGEGGREGGEKGNEERKKGENKCVCVGGGRGGKGLRNII